jgi:SAM-dependent methyltransferase
MDKTAALVEVDRAIAVVGGGRVLCVGSDAAALAAAFRTRAVEVQACTALTGDCSEPGFADKSFDLVFVRHAFDDLDAATKSVAIRRTVALARRAVLVRTAGDTREHVERQWLGHGCRKHPLGQQLVPYEGLDYEGDERTLLFEPLPAALGIGQSADDLAAERDLHTDMLREPGRRADAHIARYMLARQFVRPGDRVLDAACGLGYGSAILNDGTLAESVTGIDTSEWAITYATEHYGRSRPGVSFRLSDVMSVADLEPGTLDVIVSFETLEHIADPEGFLAACRRVLTPAGRLICSVPNEWTNEDGIDPNPHHLQVFDRERLERLCGRHFLIEHTYAQTAGGGMKLPGAGRNLWKAGSDEQGAEWWVLVGMTEPTGDRGPVRHGLAGPTDDRINVLAFDRDYDNPWLVRAMVTIGLRTESPAILSELAARTLRDGVAVTPDAGAALCVQAYRHLDRDEPMPDGLRRDIRRFIAASTDVPHTFRWQVSLQYVLALSLLQQGSPADAARALEGCATSDALRFAPHLATKTVSAAFLRGWMALQAGRISVARHWWKLGIDQAERALHRPWSDLLMNREEPALFGLREAATVVDLASQCAAGLALASHAADRPGLVASQLFESLRARAERAGQNVAASAPTADGRPERRWALLDRLDDVTLRQGTPDQLAKWTLTMDGAYASALLLHPPATLDATIPAGAAGRLTTAVAIHPDAWGRPNASACAFSIRADNAIAMTIVIDPHHRESDRRWVEMEVDLPATASGTHELTLETRTLGAPDFAWALFRDPVFHAHAPIGAPTPLKA